MLTRTPAGALLLTRAMRWTGNAGAEFPVRVKMGPFGMHTMGLRIPAFWTSFR